MTGHPWCNHTQEFKGLLFVGFFLNNSGKAKPISHKFKILLGSEERKKI